MKKLGHILGILLLLMLVLSFTTVILHLFFNFISIQVQELIIYLHSIVFMIGIIYTFAHDKHVRIDLFFQNFSKSKQKAINFYGSLILLLPFFAFIFYASFPYVLSSWSRLETSSEPGGLPFIYAIKSLLLILPFGMIVYTVNKLIRKK